MRKKGDMYIVMIYNEKSYDLCKLMINKVINLSLIMYIIIIIFLFLKSLLFFFQHIYINLW